MKRVMMTVILLLGIVPGGHAHCQVPCGIYDDHMRIHQIEEHIATMEKSMTMIRELSQAGEKNYNQIVRWVNNKEEYAREVSDIVVSYFMDQRLAPVEPGAEGYDRYITQLRLLHKVLVLAMKAKQGTDVEVLDQMRSSLAAFELLYFEPQVSEETVADKEH